ncbi:hypothetical protein B0H34DRAFT_662838 [Crassisporium funariophilum]|nr:hypothetical protein B0H34DRAFT_662838 [Crassisporium funariophilum]
MDADTRCLHCDLNFCTVKWVHWLCAQAQYQCWSEECIIVEYKMQWTVWYFINKSSLWMASTFTNTNEFVNAS